MGLHVTASSSAQQPLLGANGSPEAKTSERSQAAALEIIQGRISSEENFFRTSEGINIHVNHQSDECCRRFVEVASAVAIVAFIAIGITIIAHGQMPGFSAIPFGGAAALAGNVYKMHTDRDAIYVGCECSRCSKHELLTETTNPLYQQKKKEHLQEIKAQEEAREKLLGPNPYSVHPWDIQRYEKRLEKLQHLFVPKAATQAS